MNQNVIDLLDELCIGDIQITIDGIKETHNKKRPHYKNDDSFEMIISNIDKLVNKKGKKNNIAN